MNTSDRGIQLIEEREGKRLQAYQDSIGIWTVGVGHTGPEVCRGYEIDDAQCTEILRGDLQEAEDAINRLVTVDLTQDQFDALVSFVFNVGEGNFEHSTLLRKLNAGDYEGAAAQFAVWDRAGGMHLAGLAKRRHGEASQFRGELA